MLVRAKEAVAVRDPDLSGRMRVLSPAEPVPSDDPIVAAYPWAFISDTERSGDVEDATANPGTRRSTKRPDTK